MSKIRRNRLEASAHRLNLDMRFEKLPETNGHESGWCITARDGRQCEYWLGRNIADAVIAFEAKYDRESYLYASR